MTFDMIHIKLTFHIILRWRQMNVDIRNALALLTCTFPKIYFVITSWCSIFVIWLAYYLVKIFIKDLSRIIFLTIFLWWLCWWTARAKHFIVLLIQKHINVSVSRQQLFSIFLVNSIKTFNDTLTFLQIIWTWRKIMI